MKAHIDNRLFCTPEKGDIVSYSKIIVTEEVHKAFNVLLDAGWWIKEYSKSGDDKGETTTITLEKVKRHDLEL